MSCSFLLDERLRKCAEKLGIDTSHRHYYYTHSYQANNTTVAVDSGWFVEMIEKIVDHITKEGE